MAERVSGDDSDRDSSGDPNVEKVVYKFIELSIVTDESLGKAVNETIADGWSLDRIHFVTSASSRRPQMAFIAFIRVMPSSNNGVR